MSFLKRMFGGGPPPGQPDHPLLLERGRNELVLKNDAHDRMWGLGAAAWEADLTAGTIVFNSPKGFRVSAPVQVIGTLDSRQGTWMWGWDHPSVPEPCAQTAKLLYAHGERFGLADYTTRVIACDDAKAWDFAALGIHLANDQGAYRGPAGTTFVYMTFGTVTMAKAE